VDLKHPFAVVLGERLEVAAAVAPSLGLGQYPHGHSLAEHGQPALQGDHPLLVQEHQCPVEGSQGVADLGGQDYVAAYGLEDVLGGEGYQQLAAGWGARRDLLEDHPQGQLGQGTAALGGLAQRGPAALQLDVEAVPTAVLEVDAAAYPCHAAAVPGQAVQQLAQGLQGRDDDGEQTSALVAHQGGELIAQGLAPAGGQNCEEGSVAQPVEEGGQAAAHGLAPQAAADEGESLRTGRLPLGKAVPFIAKQRDGQPGIGHRAGHGLGIAPALSCEISGLSHARDSCSQTFARRGRGRWTTEKIAQWCSGGGRDEGRCTRSQAAFSSSYRVRGSSW